MKEKLEQILVYLVVAGLFLMGIFGCFTGQLRNVQSAKGRGVTGFIPAPQWRKR